ncbi:MAG: hypothetical protein IKK09_04405 [Clostridia bacterium]|nr:hypothetical protein [Clostridia bacterium]
MNFGRKSILTAFLSIALVLSLLMASGCGKEPEKNQPDTSTAESQSSEFAGQADAAVTAEPSTVEKSEKVKEAVTDEVSTEEASTEEATEAVPQTKEEIVELFNTAANKIKKNAAKVVKNYEKRTVNNDKTEIPGALESFAENMIPKVMGDDTKPTVWATREEIVAEYIVPEQNYASKLKPEWVTSAVCDDKGDTYEITLKLKDHKNPTAGVGVGAVCDVIETHEVSEKAPFVEEFSTQYYSCVVKATIDKATGNVIHTNYTTPLMLIMRVNLFGTHSGTMGFTFEKDYTITY